VIVPAGTDTGTAQQHCRFVTATSPAPKELDALLGYILCFSYGASRMPGKQCGLMATVIHSLLFGGWFFVLGELELAKLTSKQRQ